MFCVPFPIVLVACSIDFSCARSIFSLRSHTTVPHAIVFILICHFSPMFPIPLFHILALLRVLHSTRHIPNATVPLSTARSTFTLCKITIDRSIEPVCLPFRGQFTTHLAGNQLPSMLFSFILFRIPERGVN